MSVTEKTKTTAVSPAAEQEIQYSYISPVQPEYDEIFPDLDYAGIAKHCESARGDCYLSQRDSAENSVIGVLSDGLGSGIKANVLATLTAKIALNMFSSGDDLERSARLIYTSLPSCSVRRISYATFSIVRFGPDNKVSIIEFDNPPSLIVRNGQILNVDEESYKVDRPNAPQAAITRRVFEAEPGDRVVFFSDGVSQAGMGSRHYPLGWQDHRKYITGLIKNSPDISATGLSRAVMRKALSIDEGRAKDDITCAVLHIRKPRLTMLVSGPPFREEQDGYMSRLLAKFPGSKIVCGGTTAQIISREWNTPVKMDLSRTMGSLPPTAQIEGVDLVTEGILTLSALKVALEAGFHDADRLEEPVLTLGHMLLGSDHIHIVGGTRINEAHQDPSMPVQLEMRRNMLRSLAEILREKYLKQVSLEFV